MNSTMMTDLSALSENEPKTQKIIQNIKAITPGEFLFSSKIIGRDQITGTRYTDDCIEQGIFPLAINLGYSYPYNTKWFHKGRLWQFQLAQTYMVVERKYIPYSAINLPEGEINIPRSSGKVTKGRINREIYNAGAIRSSKTAQDSTYDYYLNVIFDDDEETYTKHVPLTLLLKVNPEIKTLKIRMPLIKEICKETDLESEFREEVYDHFYDIYYQEYIKKFLTPIIDRISNNAGIFIDLDIDT